MRAYRLEEDGESLKWGGKRVGTQLRHGRVLGRVCLVCLGGDSAASGH